MKKVFLIAILVILAAFLVPAYADSSNTIQPTAQLVNEADANDAAVDVNNATWGAIVTANWPEILQSAYTLKIKFYVYDSATAGPNDTTFSYQFYLADYGCSGELVASGTATCGATQLSHSPVSITTLNGGDPNTSYCWVDTLGTVTQDWATGHVATQNDGGADNVASLLINRESAKRMWCRIYDRSSSTMTVYCVAYFY
jgi:type II secretory pathway pseudopilin PulG